MPYKNFAQRDRDQALKCFFRWEFIRRNGEYRADFAAYLETFGPWFRQKALDLASLTGFDLARMVEFEGDLGSESEDYRFYEKFLFHPEAFREKWGVAWPCRPDFTFDPRGLQAVRLEKARMALRHAPVITLGRVRVEADIAALAREIEDRFSSIHSVLAKVPEASEKSVSLGRFEYSRHLPRDVILDQLRRRLIEEEVRSTAELRRRERKAIARFRPKPLSEYLKVWDAREANPNSTWAHLARTLYPEEFVAWESRTKGKPDQKNPIYQRVRDRYARANELISGGFQEIR